MRCFLLVLEMARITGETLTVTRGPLLPSRISFDDEIYLRLSRVFSW